MTVTCKKWKTLDTSKKTKPLATSRNKKKPEMPVKAKLNHDSGDRNVVSS